jgi:hypothetical protein
MTLYVAREWTMAASILDVPCLKRQQDLMDRKGSAAECKDRPRGARRAAWIAQEPFGAASFFSFALRLERRMRVVRYHETNFAAIIGCVSKA